MARYGITVKPGSKKGPLVEVADDGSLVIFVRERAVDGAANDGVVKLLAAHFRGAEVAGRDHPRPHQPQQARRHRRVART